MLLEPASPTKTKPLSKNPNGAFKYLYSISLYQLCLPTKDHYNKKLNLKKSCFLPGFTFFFMPHFLRLITGPIKIKYGMLIYIII